MLSKNKTNYIRSLADKKNREIEHLFVVEGNKSVSDLLHSGMKASLLVATPSFLDQLSDITNQPAEEIIEAGQEEIRKASQLKNPQQAIALFPIRKPLLTPTDLKGKLSLALDTIQDPGNLGTIIRLADWFGIEQIICSESTVDVYNPKVIQATMGAFARVKIQYCYLADFLSQCHTIALPIYGTFLDGRNIYQETLTTEGLIVMGNEGNGISQEVEKLVTQKLYIPSYPPDRITSESLNVAVATSIICAEFRRRNFRS